ncbi:type 1 phosphatases regulator ypi1 [Drosophila subpulchrella]|uniref:type 1 phosphatases regulator ypi1 n=1 Tax=Drosophila subpulchrella TaxID=1486046 RepID=UPI0018A1A3E7|nr:type 1 phosphatases regulator ypi1 [Drosophila subpulchrella]
MAQKQGNETTIGTTEIIDDAGSCAASQAQSTPTLQLRLEHPRDERRVAFHVGVIDNENLNRKKSKCCCIFKKPLAFDESSSEDDEDCEHCFGHPEKRRKNAKKNDDDDETLCPEATHPDGPSTSTRAVDSIPPPAEPAEFPANQKNPIECVDFEQAYRS